MRLKIVALALLLAGCNDNGSKFTAAERGEIMDIAEDVASNDAAQIDELRSQISDLEDRLERAGVPE